MRPESPRLLTMWVGYATVHVFTGHWYYVAFLPAKVARLARVAAL
jgi:hypothetical protein